MIKQRCAQIRQKLEDTPNAVVQFEHHMLLLSVPHVDYSSEMSLLSSIPLIIV